MTDSPGNPPPIPFGTTVWYGNTVDNCLVRPFFEFGAGWPDCWPPAPVYPVYVSPVPIAPAWAPLPQPLSDDDIDRIARRVAEILKGA